MTDRPIRRALLSVSDKTGIVELASTLAARGTLLISTGGTAKALRNAGLAVTDVSEVTGFPEILDGRVKTLHPAIYGGILADRGRRDHVSTLAEHGLEAIDLVVVNLYPFERTVAAGADFALAIENIDIGGPALIRAAAKNHGSVGVLTDPTDYGRVLAELEANGAIGPDLRRELAAKAFARTAAYDAAIAAWMAREPFPERLTVAAMRRQVTRYGENPHQRAGFYVTADARPGVATARQLQGKELSYNNIADTDAAFELVAELDAPGVAIIKHANPCGVAVAGDLVRAHAAALACDPISAYGGIVACNRPLDRATAEAITRVFTEVVIAPGADEAATEVFGAKPNLRLLLTDAMPDPGSTGTMLRSVSGGLLVQDRDARRIGESDLRVVTRRPPDERELRDLLFAFTIAKHVKSNAIVLARDGATIGIGAGQMSRLDSARIAIAKAQAARPALLDGCVVASDAFFPFPDALEETIAAGATAAIQPGGSLRDEEVVASADAAGIAMVLTGVRHFRH